MNSTQLALTLAITGVASGILARLNEERLKTTSAEEAAIQRCGIEGSPALMVCGSAPVDDDVVASDGQDVQDDVPPTPVGDPPPSTDFRSLPIYG